MFQPISIRVGNSFSFPIWKIGLEMTEKILFFAAIFSFAIAAVSCKERPETPHFPQGAIPNVGDSMEDRDISAQVPSRTPPEKDDTAPMKAGSNSVPPQMKESEAEKFPLMVPLPFSLVPKPLKPPTNSPAAIGKELLVYRLAVAGGLKFQEGKNLDQSIAEIKTFVQDMNQIYHRDLSIEFRLVSDDLEKKLMMTPENNVLDRLVVPSSGLLPVTDKFIYNTAGSENYDIGHTLFYDPPDGSGWGSDSPCYEGRKGWAVSFNYSAFLHEVGHQFSAPHSCYTEGSQGMSNTIMCRGGENSDYFHVVSIDSIINYSRKGVGKNCGTRIQVANTAPRPYLGFNNSVTIPAQTAFALVGGAIDDEDQMQLTYNWQQVDPNTPINTGSYQNENAAFRTFFPTTGGFVRYIPNLPDLVSNKPTPIEVLSKVSRSYNFSLVVRDNNKLSGGVDWITAKVNVDAKAGPFKITAPKAPATWKVGNIETITWDMAGTDKAPILTSKVNILLSLDKGSTFRMIASNVPNSGTYGITVPKLLTTTGMIIIQAVENIFFAVGSDAPITIVE